MHRSILVARVLLAGLVGSAVAGGAALAEDRKYSMADLEVLAEQKSYQELGAHLLDIAPAKRDKRWKQIVTQAALGLLSQQKSDRNPFAAMVFADGFSKQFPFLLKDKTFMKQRAEVGLAGFARCYKGSYSGAPCTDRFLPYVEADPKNVDLAVKAGQLVARNQFARAAIPFFAVAVRAGKPKTCAVKRLRGALHSALALPDNYKKLIAAAQFVAKKCFKTMRSELVKKYKSGNRYVRDNLCALLKDKKALTKRQLAKSKCG